MAKRFAISILGLLSIVAGLRCFLELAESIIHKESSLARETIVVVLTLLIGSVAVLLGYRLLRAALSVSKNPS